MKTAQAITTTDCNRRDIGKQDFILTSQDGTTYIVEYKGADYWETGKIGTDMKTRKPVREFATDDDARLWLQDDHTLVNLD